MAYYVSKEDIDDLYGSDMLIRIADQDKDGVPDVDIVERGLLSADDTINAYLSTRYNVPLRVKPGILRDCGINIAVYMIAMDRSKRTEEMRIRYEDALKMLSQIALGKVGLGIPPTDMDGDGPGGIGDTRTNIGRSIDTFRGK